VVTRPLQATTLAVHGARSRGKSRSELTYLGRSRHRGVTLRAVFARDGLEGVLRLPERRRKRPGYALIENQIRNADCPEAVSGFAVELYTAVGGPGDDGGIGNPALVLRLDLNRGVWPMERRVKNPDT